MTEGWAVVQGDGFDRHVIPCFGRGHDLTMACWCKPKRNDEDPTIVVHWSHEPVAQFPSKEAADHD